MESISQILTNIFAAGLYFPIASAVMGAVYATGVMLYVIGYLKSPIWRTLGAPIVLGLRFGFPVFTIVSLAKLAGTGIK